MTNFWLRFGCTALVAGLLGLWLWFVNWLIGPSISASFAMLFGMLTMEWGRGLAKAIQDDIT